MSQKEFTPPVTSDEAYQMVAPLDPECSGMFTPEEKSQAYTRLLNFLDLILPE